MTQGRKWPLLTSFAGYRPGWVAPALIAGLTLAACHEPDEFWDESFDELDDREDQLEDESSPAHDPV